MVQQAAMEKNSHSSFRVECAISTTQSGNSTLRCIHQNSQGKDSERTMFMAALITIAKDGTKATDKWIK